VSAQLLRDTGAPDGLIAGLLAHNAAVAAALVHVLVPARGVFT
jgi:hypothetical protein